MSLRKTAKALFVILLIISPLSAFAAMHPDANSTNQALPKEYLIGPENVLTIDVYYGKEEKLSHKVRVSSEGFITFPLTGDIKVQGMTVSEVENKLTGLLRKDYFVNPQASVFVEEYSTVSILGEVEKPGSYPIKGKLTVVELISVAGGFTKIASPNKVKIIRNSPEGKKQEIRVRINDITNKGRKDKDVFLKEGDIIVVPQSLF